MLEKKLQEELSRYNAINKYGKTMIMEQDVPPTADAPVGADAIPPADPMAGAAPTDVTAAPLDAGAPMDTAAAPMDTTEEIDITDLVDMVKSVKHDIEQRQDDNIETITKMDDVFTKLNDLEVKLAQMDQVMAKIDELGAKIQEMKPETPVEKLEMRSLDSYPFNEKPQEFFNHKQGEMRQSGKNEYILTKDDVTNYDGEINKSFNPQEEEDEYRY
jgi:hypothetical protein